MVEPDLITDTRLLETACREMSGHPFVAVDTEFLREKTYWPKLCLVQLAVPGHAVTVDALAPNLDLAPLAELLALERVLKVFHASRQDIEIMYHRFRQIPTPLFDTQLAAMVCGLGDSVSYEVLVRRILGKRISKGEQYTNWSARPLRPEQLSYARADVTYLVEVYPILQAQLKARDREHWLTSELDILRDPDTYDMRPENAWTRVRKRIRSPLHLSLWKELAAWREREAQSQNVPRSRILRDEALQEIVRRQPDTVEALMALRAVPVGNLRKDKREAIVAAVIRGKINENAVQTDELPDKKNVVSDRQHQIADVLRVVLKATSDQHDIAPRLLATSSDLLAIASDDSAAVPAMTGWRRELFGQLALDIKHGRKVVQVSDGTVEFPSV